MSFSVNIIGSGNLACHLALALHQAGNQIIQIISRNEMAGNELALQVSASYQNDISQIKESDFNIFCVSDDAIFSLAKKLPKTNAIVLHSAGAISINVLEDFENFGVFYPLQTFNKNRKLDFSEIPICIEANNVKTFQKIESLAKSISNKIIPMNSEKRKAVHLAAVFANNFTNHLVGIAEDILKENEVSTDILFPLLKETFEKIKSNGATESQTGPALRGDEKTIQNHLELLTKHPKRKEIYELISKAIKD